MYKTRIITRQLKVKFLLRLNIALYKEIYFTSVNKKSGKADVDQRTDGVQTELFTN